MLTNSDEQLVARYLKGNEQAFEILIKRYLKPIYNFVYRYVGNSQDAEDITQDVFVKVWKNLKKFNQRRRFKTWIFSIAKYTSIDWLRKKKAIPFSNFENEEGENRFTETLVDPAPLPDELLEHKSLVQKLASAMEKLSPQYRMVLSLRYNDHFTFREIAEMLRESINTIKSRHRRALVRLKEIFNL